MCPDVGLVEDVRTRRRGYLDFLVSSDRSSTDCSGSTGHISSSGCIGIEIMREGKRLYEYTGRYDALTEGYAPLSLQHWVAVDFRWTQPRTTKGTAGTVFVVLKAGCGAATIMQEHHADEQVVLLP